MHNLSVPVELADGTRFVSVYGVMIAKFMSIGSSRSIIAP
jgi:hypothetical protein